MSPRGRKKEWQEVRRILRTLAKVETQLQKGGGKIPKKQKFNQSKYIQGFIKERYLRLQILLSKEKDADIIERLNQEQNKSEYVKRLIRKDSQ